MKDSRTEYWFLAYRPRALVNGKKETWKPMFHHPPLHHTLREAKERYTYLLMSSNQGHGQNEYSLRPVKEREKQR